jgi:hypothetical protein
MNTQFPDAPAGYSGAFFNQLLTQLRTYFGQAVAKDEETPRVILHSPNGTRYDVTVSDAGVLVITPTAKSRV